MDVAYEFGFGGSYTEFDIDVVDVAIDGTAVEVVVNRIKKQMPQDKYEALADYIVYNNNSIDELKNKVKDILSKLI